MDDHGKKVAQPAESAENGLNWEMGRKRSVPKGTDLEISGINRHDEYFRLLLAFALAEES